MSQQEILDYLKEKYDEDPDMLYAAKDICVALDFSTPCRNRAFNSLIKSGAIERKEITKGYRKMYGYRFKTLKIEVLKDEQKTKKTIRHAWRKI